MYTNICIQRTNASAEMSVLAAQCDFLKFLYNGT